jgi:hypothetical protein
MAAELRKRGFGGLRSCYYQRKAFSVKPLVGASSVVSPCIAVMAFLIERPPLRIHAEGSPTQEEKKTQVIALGVVLLLWDSSWESPCW